jgi:hypothetical protein
MKMGHGPRESSLCPIQMVRKHTKKTAGRRHRRRTVKRGGGYGFGGSLLSNVGGPNAGNPQWNYNMGSDCGADLQGRGGNNNMSGGRRRRKTVAGRRRRRTYRGGSNQVVNNSSILALQQPRTGYTFNGSGVAGTADTVPVGSPVYQVV